MSWVRRTRRLVVVLASLVCLLATGVGAGVASASSPWWHVNTMSAPSTTGGEATVLLYVDNIGDEETTGTVAGNFEEYAHAGETRNFVTITDTLPAGVTPVSVHKQSGGPNLGNRVDEEEEEALVPFKRAPLCSIVGQTVTCKRLAPVRPFEQVIIAIQATVTPGDGNGQNTLTVSGGGAREAALHRALALESSTGFGLQSYELMPEQEGGLPATQAGSHEFQLTSTVLFNTRSLPVALNLNAKEAVPEIEGYAYAKDARFILPPGLIGNPTPLPKCSLKEFSLIATLTSGGEKPHCPLNTIIGVATTISAPPIFAKYVPTSTSFPIYNLEPSAGEPAKFGFQVPTYGPVILDTSVQTGGGYGVVVTVPDITQNAQYIGSEVTFWGDPSNPTHDGQRGEECLGSKTAWSGMPAPACRAGEKQQPLLIMPTSCEAAPQSSAEVDSWDNPGGWTEPLDYAFQDAQGEPFAIDGCNQLNFEPSLTLTPDGHAGSTPTGLTVGVHVPQEGSVNPNGLAESAVKDTSVTLPVGVALDPSGADGLMACGLGEIGLSSPAEQSCPDAAKVGTVEIETPLLPNKLEGFAYLAAQEQNPFGSLIGLYIVAKDPVSGVLVKLAGEVTPCKQTGEILAGVTCQAAGQLVSTFKETPELPFENLRLHFFGGSRGPLGTPAQCGSYSAGASIAPWSGNPASQLESPPFVITSGPKTLAYPNGSPCPGSSLPFGPELVTGSLNLQAGAFTPFTMTMSREDGQQQLDAVQLHMPPGLSGLLAGVELCPEPQASEGLCGPNSLIGETTVSVGLGNTPYTVKGGKVYITGPYEGAPFGLSIVNPAKAGPFDLEKTKTNHPACDCLVVRARIEVDPATAALTVTSDTTGPHAIPTILEGIPLQIKHVNVTINRPGFTFNPTSCEKMAITGSLTSDQGATSTLSVPFQVTNCATLGFKPSFNVSTSGKTSRQLGASLHVKLTYPKAPFGSQANIKSVKVDLPKQLPSNLPTLNRACLVATFNQNPAACPSASRVGFAKAITPLIPVPLEGPAYFVSYGGAKFPELIVVLQGYGVTIDLHGETFINKEGITSSTFHTVPDAPVGSFELTLPEGQYPALHANTNLCAITKTILVKHKVKVRSKGRTHTITRKERKTVTGSLVMPTAFTAQNGMVIHQNTPITVTGCARHKAEKAKANRHGKHQVTTHKRK